MTRRNFGFSGPSQSACGDLGRLAVFVVVMFLAGATLLFGGLYIQHTLRAWGFHV